MKKKINRIKFKAILEVRTGLHIGAGDDTLQIGGTDSGVVKNPVNGLPYIPGSSLKGKIRYLLEMETDIKKEEIENIFGSSNMGENNRGSMTKALFRDALLTSKWKNKYKNGEIENEVKAETNINRETLIANPRFIERVPVGVQFKVEVVIRGQEEDLNDIEEIIKKGFRLLEEDYLGGSGSRGYGAVKIVKLDDNKADE